jgi:hypothetical protein
VCGAICQMARHSLQSLFAVAQFSVNASQPLAPRFH